MQVPPPSTNHEPQKTGLKILAWTGGGIGLFIGIIIFVITVLPGLVYVMFFMVASGVNTAVGEENMPYASNNLKGVTESVAKFTPHHSWTQISKTDVHKPAKCADADRAGPDKDCEMFKGVWNTNAPLTENGIIEIADRFGGINKYYGQPELIKSSCVRPAPDAPLGTCTTTTYVEGANNNSYGFTLSLADNGPGTDVIATVTYVR